MVHLNEDKIFVKVAWRGAPRIKGSSDSRSIFLRTLYWLDPMGLASGAGSVALPTTCGGKVVVVGFYDSF